MRESRVQRPQRVGGWVCWMVVSLMLVVSGGVAGAQTPPPTDGTTPPGGTVPPTDTGTMGGTVPPTDTGTTQQPKPKPTRHKLTIMHTSDIYGRLRDFRCKRPGAKGHTDDFTETQRDLANLLYQVKQIQDSVGKEAARSQFLAAQAAMQSGKSKNVPVYTAGWLLFNTGDNLATDLTARFLLEFRGIAGIDFMAETFERFSYQLVGIGNHEFSVSPDKLRDFLKQASLKNVKFAVANLEDAYTKCLAENKQIQESNKLEKNPALHQKLKVCTRYPKHALMRYIGNKQRYTVFNKGSLKIGVFHMVPKDLQRRVSKRAAQGIAFSDPAMLAGQLAEKLRTEEKVDLVVMLSHLEGSSSRGQKVRELLSQLSGENQRIDLVITNELRESGNPTGISTFDKQGNGVYIVGAAKYGSQLGRVDLTIEKQGDKSRVVSFQSRSIPLTNHFEPELRRELIKWERSYCKRWGQPLGDGRIRTAEGMSREQFLKYLLNLMRYMADAEVAIINDGAVRSGRFFPIKGYVTKDDLFRALPFNNKFEVLRLTGQQINDLLKFEPDTAKDKRLRFVGAEGGNINGRMIDTEATYKVITISYVADNSGGWLDKAPTRRQKFLYSRVTYQGRSVDCTPANMKGVRNAVIKELCSPRTRDTMQLHFETNQFRKLPPAPPPKPDSMGMGFTTQNTQPTYSSPNAIPMPRVATRQAGAVAGSGGDLAPLSGKGHLVAQNTPSTPPATTPPATTPPADPNAPPATTPPPTDPNVPPATTPPVTTPPVTTTPGVTTPKKPKPPKPFGPNEIPYTGEFYDLRDKVAWTFKANLAGGFTSIFINPNNISQFYAQHENLSGGFYQKYAIEAQVNLDLQLDTRIHLWKTNLQVNYNADFSLQFGTDPPAPVYPIIFQEASDRTILSTEYRLRYFSALFQERKWYHTDPFFQISAETELTTGTRPDLSRDQLAAALINEVFHHLQLNAKAGLSFQLAQPLTFKVGFTVQKEFAPATYVRLQNCAPDPNNPNKCISTDPRQLSINTDLNLGASFEYELQQWEIFRIGKTPFSWASKGEYKLTFLVGGQEGFDIHDFRWENSFSFNIVGNLSLSFGFKFFLFRGIFKPNPVQNDVFVRGPLAFRIDPFIRLNVRWATRGQVF